MRKNILHNTFIFNKLSYILQLIAVSARVRFSSAALPFLDFFTPFSGQYGCFFPENGKIFSMFPQTPKNDELKGKLHYIEKCSPVPENCRMARGENNDRQ